MLVLTRRLDQAIMIGNPSKPEIVVEVVVAEVRGDHVRLGFKAPHDVIIDRKEIWVQKQAEKVASQFVVLSEAIE